MRIKGDSSMKLLIAIALLVLPSITIASPYLRLFDPAHPQVGAGLLISPKTPSRTLAVTDIALVTHSTADGTIIPESWQPFLPPMAWGLQLGVGGSFTGEATIAPGLSANLAPALAALALSKVDGQSAAWAQALKTALSGSSQGQLRIGGALAGIVAKEGHFQSAKAAFPGRGVGEILGNAARVDVGYAWKF